MSMMKSLRPWATPLTVATTLVTLVTGVLLFFHLAPGLTRVSHEWIGMIMVIAVAAHLLLNYRAFFTYFKRPIGLAIIGLGAVAMVLSLVFSPASTGEGPSGMRAALMAMNSARIETLADLAGQDEAMVLEKLGAAGFDAAPESKVSDLAGGDRAKQDEIIGVIFSR